MQFIGILVTLAVLGYTASVYLGSSAVSSSDENKTTPVEYIDHAKQSTDAVKTIMLKQKKQLDAVNSGRQN